MACSRQLSATTFTCTSWRPLRSLDQWLPTISGGKGNRPARAWTNVHSRHNPSKAVKPTKARNCSAMRCQRTPVNSCSTKPRRALVVAWAVRPDLDRQALPGWLRGRLFVQVTPADLDAALEALRAEGALDAQDHPQVKQLSNLVDEWGLRAWVREARRVDEDQG